MCSFLSWWFGQLAGMFAIAPAREHSDAVILEIGRHSVSLLLRFGGTITREAQSSADHAGIQQLAGHIAMRSDLPRLRLLRLQPAQVLHNQLSLPIAARNDLREAPGFEIDRETPFRRDDVYWNYTVRRLDASGNRIGIDLAVVPRLLVDSIVDSARRAGLDPSSIEVDIGANTNALIPVGMQKRARRVRSQGSLAPLAPAACILVAIAIDIPFIRQQWALASAEAMIASLNEPASEALALRQPADQLTRIVTSLKKERERTGITLAALAAASKSLPDETYLTALRLSVHHERIIALSRATCRFSRSNTGFSRARSRLTGHRKWKRGARNIHHFRERHTGARVVIWPPDGIVGKPFAPLIGVATFGAIDFAAVAPLFSYYESAARRLQDRQELARRYQNLARDLPRLRAAATQGLGQSPDGDLLLTGSTDTVAAASL